MKYKIRSMRISEFPTVTRLIYDSVHILCANDYTKEELDAWVPEDLHMPSFFSSLTRCHTIVALDEKNEVVGVMSTERDGYVNRLYARFDCAGKGVGSALLAETEGWARKKGIKRLTLEASRSAENFYWKMGFVKTGTVKSVKNNVPFESAKMRKELLRDGETGKRLGQHNRRGI